MSEISIECHPIPPFFPYDARVLFLGSFPPPRSRWCMDFFYPNLQNDFWRIFGLVFFNDRDHFLTPRPSDGKKIFDRERIIEFLLEKKIALYDSAVEVIRERGNASDAHLTVVTPLDLRHVLTHDLPECQTLITTGEKATETLLQILDGVDVTKPPIGSSVKFHFAGREMTLCRLPSSSRAYPLKIGQKAAIYRKIIGKEE